MPCYDGRENERQVLVTDEHRARLAAEWTHNSPVAELLCGLMTHMEPYGNVQFQSYLHNNPELRRWWRQHQERDRRRATGKGKRK